MDAAYFLKQRTDFIRFYYDTAEPPFRQIKQAIEDELPPFDDPPYSEDPEPAYLQEWMDANTGARILGLSCVSLLSDSLKLYFHTLQSQVIGFSFADNKPFRDGFVPAFLGALGEILETDWSDCPADLAIIEQVTLARNSAQHGSHLTSIEPNHDHKTFAKHSSPFFASEAERVGWPRDDGTLPSFLMATIEVTREKLFAAITEIEKLVDYIDARSDKIWDWRTART